MPSPSRRCSPRLLTEWANVRLDDESPSTVHLPHTPATTIPSDRRRALGPMADACYSTALNPGPLASVSQKTPVPGGDLRQFVAS